MMRTVAVKECDIKQRIIKECDIKQRIIKECAIKERIIKQCAIKQRAIKQRAIKECAIEQLHIEQFRKSRATEPRIIESFATKRHTHHAVSRVVHHPLAPGM